jgi:hypothetical protein
VNPLWLVPGLVLLVGGAATVALLRGAAEEARLLLDELGRQREVGASARRLSASLARLESPLRGRR